MLLLSYRVFGVVLFFLFSGYGFSFNSKFYWLLATSTDYTQGASNDPANIDGSFSPYPFEEFNFASKGGGGAQLSFLEKLQGNIKLLHKSIKQSNRLNSRKFNWTIG